MTGADRATWLHNLTTNQVKNLGRGEGSYAFVLNIQGRILFDVNLLVRADSIWLDLDRRFLETAKKHFAKYIITEDVAVADRSEESVRFGLVGSGAALLLSELGAPNAAAMAQLNHVTIDLSIADQSRDREGADKQNRDYQGAVPAAVTSNRSMPVAVLMVRHDFCGPFAVELFVPAEKAVDFWRTHVESGKAVPVGDDAVQVRRIEAGIPWPGHEITDEYLPAETRQLDRAVAFQKGCYLGQEVVERMRSRHVVARQLVGLRIDTPSPSEQWYLHNYPSSQRGGLGRGGLRRSGSVAWARRRSSSMLYRCRRSSIVTSTPRPASSAGSVNGRTFLFRFICRPLKRTRTSRICSAWGLFSRAKPALSREGDASGKRMGRLSSDRLRQFQASGSVVLQDQVEGLSVTADSVVYERPRQILAISGSKQRKAQIITQKPGRLPNQVATERLFYNLATGKLELVQTTVKGQ